MIASSVTLSDNSTGFSSTKDNKNVQEFLQDFSFEMGDVLYTSKQGFDAELKSNNQVVGKMTVIF